ncbi:MAG: hypothetical protein ACO363_08805, partial [Balneolaceae bacterium]
ILLLLSPLPPDYDTPRCTYGQDSFERARSLAAAANRLNSESDSLIQEINTRIFKLVILQNALFESGNTEAAEELTREVTAMTGDRFPFPTNAEASAREVGRYNLGI